MLFPGADKAGQNTQPQHNLGKVFLGCLCGGKSHSRAHGFRQGLLTCLTYCADSQGHPTPSQISSELWGKEEAEGKSGLLVLFPLKRAVISKCIQHFSLELPSDT